LVDILSQAEIEALLASLTGEGGNEEVSHAETSAPHTSYTTTDTAPTHRRDEKRSIAYEIYDFRRPDKFSKDQLRTLQMLHETFARLFSSSLSAYLRVPTHVDLVSVEQVPYEEYMRSLTSSIINIFSMPPLTGQAILEMEFNIILSMIDRLLGGPGNMVKNTNALTDIEQALTESIVQRALKELKTAWEGVVQFNPRRESMETQAQFIQIVPSSDIVVSILFEVKIGELRGAMSLCIPYLLLKPITSKLSAQRWFASHVKKRTGLHSQILARQLRTTYVHCICRLGQTQMSVQELMALKVGDTVVLNRKATDEVDFLIGDSIKFRGKPGTSGRKVALYINRVVTGEEMGLA